MAELPSGTVTFLFTDIEGSTRLLHGLGDDYAVVLRDHNALLAEAVEAHGGRIVDTQGDSFFCVFSRVKDAAAAEARRTLSRHEWPQEAQVKVRMGIHAAEPELEEGRFGLGVHRAARVGSAAHGGQVLLSNAAAVMLGDSKLELRDLGQHALKDFDKPERLYQLQVQGLPVKFPSPRTGRPRRSPRRLLIAIAAVAVAAAGISLPLALTGGSSTVKVGPASLAVIDPKTNKVVDGIDLGFKSNLIAGGEGHVWLIDPKASTLVSVDPRRHDIVQRTGIESDVAPSSIAAGGGAVWIVGVKHGRKRRPLGSHRRGADLILMQINPTTGVLTRSTVLGSSDPVLNLAGYVAADARAVWVLESETNRVSRVNPATGLRRVLAKGVAGATWGITVGKGAVWTAGLNTVTRVDPRTGAVASTPPLPGVDPASTTASQIAAGGGSVWFATTGSDSVWRVDPGTVQAAGTAPVGMGSQGIAYGEGATWVAASDGTVTRVDPASGRTIATVNVGQPLGGIVAAYGKVWVTQLT